MFRKPFILTWCIIVSIVSITVVAIGIQSQPPTVEAKPQNPSSTAKPIFVNVKMTSTGTVKQIPLEQYVLGVVAAEMPDHFANEALKAQAIAARTYVVHKILEAKKKQPAKPFVVRDDVKHQMFFDPVQLEKKWKQANDLAGFNKLRNAVRDTKDIIITYQNGPIDATYFSTSNGFTEGSGDYWGQDIPYLQSVASPWDPVISNRYKASVRMTYADIVKRLGIKSNNAKVTVRSMRVLQKSDGKRVKKLKIGNKTMSGRQFREKLALRSTHFVWKLEDHHILITTYGNGHGVGLSQWGAHGMALKGYKSSQILKHYYRGVNITPITTFLPKLR